MRIIAVAALTGAIWSAAAQDVHELPPVPILKDGTQACPSDTDIKNIDTRLSSRLSPPANERSLRAERQRAVKCRTAGPHYTRGDWERLTAIVRGDI